MTLGESRVALRTSRQNLRNMGLGWTISDSERILRWVGRSTGDDKDDDDDDDAGGGGGGR